MWNTKAKVIPIITATTRAISKSFRKYLNNVPGKHKIKELQKTVVLDMACMLQKALN
jgi:hypothetical protein